MQIDAAALHGGLLTAPVPGDNSAAAEIHPG
jgi:hypothetical protein